MTGVQTCALPIYAEGGADGILTAVALAHRVFLVVNHVVVVLQLVDDLLRHLGHAVLLHERQHGHLHGGQGGRELQHDARVAPFVYDSGQ